MRLLHQAALMLLLLLPLAGQATVVRLQTILGTVDIQLYDSQAPLTVANFLGYVNSGTYNASFVHRSVPGFVIQGGGYFWDNTVGVKAVATKAAVVNEFSATRSNLRGTIAMAKVGRNPNSATNQWFVNLADNSMNLDNQNGGFTVFGRVIGNGMAIIDAIAALEVVNAGGDFTNLPVTSVPASGQIAQAQLVMVTSVTVLPEPSPFIDIVRGWNLLGNSVEAPITVANTFNDAAKINSVWKWIPAQAKWAFYTPTQSDGGAAIASSKGYDALMTINAGEGFWVNANTAFSVSSPSGTTVQSETFQSGGTHALQRGWNLIATGDSPTPSSVDAALASKTAAPPTGGQVYANLTTLWAWDATKQNWYFWAPSLVNSGDLASYIASKGYLDSADLPGTPTGTISPTTGVWVNVP